MPSDTEYNQGCKTCQGHSTAIAIRPPAGETTPPRQPSAAAADRDSRGPSSTPPAGQQRELPVNSSQLSVISLKNVRVFGPGEPLSALDFRVSEWEAHDRVRRNEARWVKTGKRKRGIQVLPRTEAGAKQSEHTLPSCSLFQG